jgi:uncharacterized protein (TIGR02058 family)
MDRKRFIIEMGMGIDIHGEDFTEAACRAVKDAISRSCLCGLVEILGIESLDQLEVDILIASPKPDKVDVDKVMSIVPIGIKKIQSVMGGMMVKGLCVPKFAPDHEQIVVANAAVTVFY